MNSLRVDVILESEQRSSSPVSIKSGLKIVGGLVIALFIGSVLFYVVRVKSAEKRLVDITAEWEMTGKVATRVKQEQQDLQGLTDIQNEIEGWTRARLLWHKHLADFQAIVPPTIQITSFQVDEQNPMAGAGKNAHATRVFSLNLQGRAEGENPGQTVDNFLSALRSGPGFSNLVTDVGIKVDTVPGDKTNHRVFTMNVKYVARDF